MIAWRPHAREAFPAVFEGGAQAGQDLAVQAAVVGSGLSLEHSLEVFGNAHRRRGELMAVGGHSVNRFCKILNKESTRFFEKGSKRIDDLGMEQKQQPPYPLRMPPEMRAHYEDLAAASKRSLNAEILAGLQELEELRNRNESLTNELTELRRSSASMDDRTFEREEALRRALRTQEDVTKMLAKFVISMAENSTPKEEAMGAHNLMVYVAQQVQGVSAAGILPLMKDLVGTMMRVVDAGPGHVFTVSLPEVGSVGPVQVSVQPAGDVEMPPVQPDPKSERARKPKP